MNATCDACAGKFCGTGDLTGAPKNCPSLGVSHEETLARYSEEEMGPFRESARVEAAGYCAQTRVEEIMEYARRCGYKTLGVAFCRGLSNEAAIFCKVLRANGFTVVSACCKNGCVSKTEIGIAPEEQIRKGKAYEGICNPAGQAFILDESGAELNIILGLCVGHDTTFIRHSKAPVTVLSTKDRVTGHNALAPLYCAEGYYKNKLFNHEFLCEKDKT